MPTEGSVLGRRRLAHDLRRLRIDAARTITEAADHLECSPAKVSRIETGAVGVTVQDVRALAEFYDVDAAHRDELYGLVRQARKRGWWHAYSDVLPPDSATLYGLEESAASIQLHSPSLVPGLLQTPAYARALIESAAASANAVDRRIELRTKRQAVLTEVDPPKLHAVLDEAVLRRAIGGPDTMIDQLNHLLETSRRSNITLQVTPFRSSAHPAAGVGFTIFGFAMPGVAPVVYLEHLSRNTYIDDLVESGIYLKTWSAAAKTAESPAATRSLIQRCIEDVRDARNLKQPRVSAD
jgi:transcriptional regulator with XRE-family HTH domain